MNVPQYTRQIQFTKSLGNGSFGGKTSSGRNIRIKVKDKCLIIEIGHEREKLISVEEFDPKKYL